MRRTRDDGTPLDLGGPIELIALSVAERSARCRVLGSHHLITLRASRLWDVVPGEILTIRPRKHWIYAGHPYLSGEIEMVRREIAALDLTPLGLASMGTWDPGDHYWGEEGDPIEHWTKPIIARGPRPEFEMEQVLPGEDHEDPFEDPITRSNDLKDAGDGAQAHRMLMDLCRADLRCLDAHAHLGNLYFNDDPEHALRHYAVGVEIGELSLGADFDGVLQWGFIDNRPFLRCMHGFGLSLWRLGRRDHAAAVFERILWRNPSDNQGVRFLLEEVRAGIPWRDADRE